MRPTIERVLAEQEHTRPALADPVLQNLRTAILLEDVFDVVLTDEQLSSPLNEDLLRALPRTD